MNILYLLVGALSGTLSGLLGIGGGVVVVPALAALYLHYNVVPVEYHMHLAIGTSLAVMIVTMLSAVHAHMKRRTMRWDLVRNLLPGMMIGSVVGACIAHSISSAYLRVIFAVFLLLIGLQLLISKRKAGEELTPTPGVLRVVASAVGTISALLGAGGGALLIPFLLRYRVDMRHAAGASVACGVGIGIIATIVFMILNFTSVNLPWSTGFIYWPAFVCVAVSSTVCAPLGVRLAAVMPTQLLKRILAVCLLLLAVEMLYTG